MITIRIIKTRTRKIYRYSGVSLWLSSSNRYDHSERRGGRARGENSHFMIGEDISQLPDKSHFISGFDDKMATNKKKQKRILTHKL